MAMPNVRVLGNLWPGALVWALGIISVGALIVVLGDQVWAITTARKVSARSASQSKNAEVSVWSTGAAFRKGLGGATNFPNLLLTIGPDQVSLRQMTRIAPATSVVTRQSEHHFRVPSDHQIVEDHSGLSVRLGRSEAERARRALLSFGWLPPPVASPQSGTPKS